MSRRRKRKLFLMVACAYAAVMGLSTLLAPDPLPRASIVSLDAQNTLPVLHLDASGQAFWERMDGFSQPDPAPYGTLHTRDISPSGIGPGLASEPQTFHVVAERYASLHAVALAIEHPERVQSLTLIDPHGLWEFEWIGSPLLDRSVRSLSSVLNGFAIHLLPFSWQLGLPLEQSFWESSVVMHTKLEPFREQLRKLTVPVLIVVPQNGFEQANEVHRIVPHAILATTDLQVELGRFLLETETQKDSALFQATPERMSSSVNGMPVGRLEFAGWSLVLVLALIAMCTLVSEDLTCVGVGLLVSNGAIGFWQGCLGCYVGFLFGDLLIYWLGRAFGEVLIKKRPFRWFLSEKAVLQSEAWFERRGVWVLFASRFMPGTRVPVYFAAGILKASWWSVIWTLSVASIIWIPGLVWISTVVGDSVIRFFEQSQFWTLAGIVVVCIFIFWLTHTLVPLLTFRGRRLAFSRWMRWSRWEFWPPVIVYLPVYAYIFFQALKRRSLSVATLANPMIPCGGLVGESKGDILEHLTAAGAPVAPFLRLNPDVSAEALRDQIRSFFDQNQYPAFPVVLKPEAGQRGYGVQILRDECELMIALDSIDEPHLLQRYVAGPEFGVFYHRMPGAAGGTISSINRKSFLSLTGDGKHFIETLILKDPRAVCTAPMLLRQHTHQLYRIPTDGERVPLVELGSHARGCLFLDGRDLITDALVAALDRICLPVEGFFFGRFDLKAPSEQDLKQGKQLTILELNLLTAEPTHIYDPKFGLFHAWQTLAAHWRIAFKIGEANRALGLKPIGWVALMLRIANHYR